MQKLSDMHNKYSPELSLILLILQNQLNNTKFMQLLLQIRWDYLYTLIIRHRVIEQVYSKLKNTPQIPANFIAKLRQTNHQIKFNLLNMHAETIRITRILEEHDLPYIIVKGIPLAIEIYGGSDKRQCKDIDLWVTPDNLEKVQKLLINAGYLQTLPSYQLSGYKKNYYLCHKHDLAFFHSERKVEIELHFRLEYFGINFFKFNQVATQQIISNKDQIVTLQHDYHVLYLMLHGAIHAWSRLRWLHDIYLYITQDKCNLTNVYQLSLELDCSHIVLQTLSLLDKVYNYQTPKINQLLSKIDKRSVLLAQAAYQFIVADYELTGGHGIFSKMFFKYRFYLAKLAAKGQRHQAIFGDLFKIDRLFPYFNLPRGCEFGYYLLYPLWIIKYIITRK
jgi:hypothetical protein